MPYLNIRQPFRLHTYRQLTIFANLSALKAPPYCGRRCTSKPRRNAGDLILALKWILAAKRVGGKIA